MPKQLNFQLTDDELKLVEQAMQSDQRAAVRQRATALRLLHLGYEVAEVATILAVTAASIYGWVRRWQQQGLPGLANRAKHVPPRKVTASYEQALEHALASDPASYGYPFVVWTLERLRDHLTQETGVHVSIQWLSVIMSEHGYVYRRPKHDLTHLQDPTAKQNAIELLAELKKGRKPALTSFSLWTKPL
jgi:transposase